MDRHGIAERIRGLVGGQNEGDLAVIAHRLEVDEVSLRMSVDALSPYPTVDVLAAVVLTYGVDPTWLLTGEYDTRSHRHVADGDKRLAEQSVRLMIEERAPERHGSERPPELRLLRDA
ncbi:MAG: hypothetical protein WD801_08595 [Gemmatimonadaceae bacterium]